jgi:hypothetical protein
MWYGTEKLIRCYGSWWIELVGAAEAEVVRDGVEVDLLMVVLRAVPVVEVYAVPVVVRGLSSHQ